MRAYALMRHPAELEAVFTDSPFYSRARIEIERIRAGLPGGLPLSYRGIGRYPFTEHAERGPGRQGEAGPPEDPEPRARALMLKLLGSYEYVTPFPRAFLGQLEDARNVYAALSAVHEYELVELCTAPEYPRDFLGFDIGYWGGGNFSILCDAAIWPLWHPRVPAALNDLFLFLGELNEHGLFPTEDAADAYFDWYTKQSWAEQDEADFRVIAVGAMNREAG